MCTGNQQSGLTNNLGHDIFKSYSPKVKIVLNFKILPISVLTIAFSYILI